MDSIDEIKNPLILFDGVCNLCNSSINFVIDRDKDQRFRFASLQSDLGQAIIARYRGKLDLDSVVLYQNGQILEKSDAALAIARELSGFWPMLGVFRIIPRPLRDVVYDWIAKNRYKWFGKKESCRIPTPELKSLFLDS